MPKLPFAFVAYREFHLYWPFLKTGDSALSLLARKMSNKCPQCRLVNFADVFVCVRCGQRLTVKDRGPSILMRAAICAAVIVAVVLGFYISLIASARPLNAEQKSVLSNAIGVLKQKGFADEAMMLEYFTVFRQDDNWLNASVAKETAYAATNFPFEIVTLYPDYFTYPEDDIERAAILLHEARHLYGDDEAEAYAFVWRRRWQLGWTEDKYFDSVVWKNIRKQTRDAVPEMFSCPEKDYGDCTE